MEYLEHLLQKHPQLEGSAVEIRALYHVLEAFFAGGGKLLVCGNGGSAADSEHMVGELMKGYFLNRPLPAPQSARLMDLFPEQGAYLAEHLQGALPAISLVCQVSLTSAISNDVAVDMVFAQQVAGYGQAGDALLGLSNYFHLLGLGV